jgi:ribose/xylose/arabinose/galactoside ABC-type transport system permease subunit
MNTDKMLITQRPWYRRYAFKQYSAILIVLIGLIVIGTVLSYQSFFTLTNFTNIIRQASIIGIVVIGATFILISGGIDLSVGSNLILSSCSAALVLTQTGNPLLAILLALAVGTAVGLLNGFLVMRFKIASFIVTLGIGQISLGLAMFITGNKIISISDKVFSGIGSSYIFGFLPMPAFICILVVIAGILIEKKSTLGRYIYAIGGNEEASKLSGIDVNKFKVIVFSMGGLFIGLAAVVQLGRMSAASNQIGTGAELEAISAAVIGGTAITGGYGSVIGSIVGVVILQILNNILNMMNVPSYSQLLLKGIILIGAIIIYQKQQSKY